MYQDHQGFMWLGTESGLFKYDGINYQPYLLPDSSLSNDVTAIHQDNQQRLWIGYRTGKIALISRELVTFFEPQEGVPVVAITGIVQDHSGTVWISTYGEGLYYYRDQRLYNLDTDDGLAANDIYTLLADHNGDIWVGTDAGISIVSTSFTPYRIKNLSVQDGLPDNIVKSITVDHAGDIWIATYDKGICRFDVSQRTIDVPSLEWVYGGVTTMVWGSNLLWIGTENSGLLQYDLRRSHFRRYQDGTKILDLLVDQEHNLWVSNNNHQLNWIQPGMSFIRNTPNNHFQEINSVAVSASGYLWFSNSDGLFRCRPGFSGNVEEKVEALGAEELPVNSIFLDEDGEVWLGTWDGIYQYSPERRQLKHFTQDHGLVNNNVLSIAGSEGNIWIATLGGVSRLRQEGDKVLFENFDNEAILGAGYIYHVFVDSKQRAWFGTDGKGLIKWEDQQFTSLEPDQPDGSKVIYSIVEDQQGNIWFSTPSNGIYQFNGRDFTHFGIEDGLRDLEINALAVDRRGNLLTVHASGLDLVNPHTGDIMYFGAESGIENLEVDLNNVAVDAEGVIWIGSSEGIICFDQWHESSEMRPTTLIDRTSVFLEPTSIPAGSTLKYSQNHVSFEYVGLWYQNPAEVVYQTKLEGFDLHWNQGKGQISTYPRLPPGDYTFKVRSSINNDFSHASVTSLSFSVDAPYWQKFWFLFLCVIIGLGLMVAIVRYREKKLRGEERLKKELVQTQLETLKSQVNPHFLFNSFNTLAGIIEDDKDSAVDYVEKLSDFFRSSLAYRDRQLITVEEELKLIENYYFLQKKRYGDNLKVLKEVNPRHMRKLIPPLTLQMLLENAVKHNIISGDKPLLINIFDKENYLYVSNNKQLKQYQEDSTGFGLYGIINRYKLITSQPVLINHQTSDTYEVGVPFLEDTSL